MKDLSNLLKDDEGWTPEGFKAYLRSSLIELIRLEMENLPKEEWERTLLTWKRICSFCKSLMKKKEDKRQELYKKFNFDQTMIYISEGIVEKLSTAYKLGLLKAEDPPERIIGLGLEGMEVSSKTLAFMKGFFKA
ncbi:MAG: hypothetical protein ACK4OF_06960 [Aquificaceae bacterium]